MSAERSHLRVTMRHHDDARVKGPLMLVRGQQLAIFRMEFQKWSATTAEFPHLTGRGGHGGMSRSMLNYKERRCSP